MACRPGRTGAPLSGDPAQDHARRARRRGLARPRPEEGSLRNLLDAAETHFESTVTGTFLLRYERETQLPRSPRAPQSTSGTLRTEASRLHGIHPQGQLNTPHSREATIAFSGQRESASRFRTDQPDTGVRGSPHRARVSPCSLHWSTAHRVTVTNEPAGRKALGLHEDQKPASGDTDSRRLSTRDVGRSRSGAIRDLLYLPKDDPAGTDSAVTSRTTGSDCLPVVPQPRQNTDEGLCEHRDARARRHKRTHAADPRRSDSFHSPEEAGWGRVSTSEHARQRSSRLNEVSPPSPSSERNSDVDSVRGKGREQQSSPKTLYKRANELHSR